MALLDRIRSLIKPPVIQISLGSDAPTQVLNYTAKTLYQSQDNLKAVVDYLANSIAQLPMKVYKRQGETDRERDRTSSAAKLLWIPNQDQTSYEFIRAVATEYFVFGCVYVWVIPDSDSPSGYQMRIIPSEWVTKSIGGSAYAADAIQVTIGSGRSVEIPRTEFVQFKTYSPGSPGGYVSPVSALRQTLQEQIEAGNFRKQLWHSSGRLNAQLLRPANVQPWDDETRKRFITAFREGWAAGGDKAGSIPLLEDGMEIKPFETSFKEQQWAESIKLSREAVAAAYGVNPSLIWHTDSQTYASAKDNARALYADCLGPVIQMLQQRINSFLFPMVGADPDTYVEFDLTEKLKGSFEERASILQASVGGPWITRNEARADNNLPPIEGGDELIVPLNVVEGGQSSPQDTHMEAQEPMATVSTNAGLEIIKAKAMEVRVKASDPTEDEQNRLAEALQKFFKRQAASILPRLGRDDWFNAKRWDKELADDLEPILDDIADAHGKEGAKEIGSEYITEQTRAYIRAMAEGRAHATNVKTVQKITEAYDSYDPEDEESVSPADVMEKRVADDAPTIGTTLATVMSGWATLESGRQAQQQGVRKRVMKEWVTGPNPRQSHAAMNGERVGIDDTFSNGAYWPGDDAIGPDESCNCNCKTDIVVI